MEEMMIDYITNNEPVLASRDETELKEYRSDQ